jgi:hypothetical protein
MSPNGSKPNRIDITCLGPIKKSVSHYFVSIIKIDKEIQKKP